MAQMQSLKPARKVWAGTTLSTAIVILIVWIIEKAASTTIPSPVVVAMTTIVTFILSYLIPPADADQVVS